ncbi:Translation_elongation factor 1-beta [Hexamita inflata]|uniref:Translation elongation factor 1-beta n=1 Tax=Hexamita inflata TaxID=28002 RepID=A0AA86P111_9EUKA|nr:Translation elongation factor 1-beta [Hexamita inflata]
MFVFDGCLKKLNEQLADKAYVDGFKLTKNDGAVMMQVCPMEIPAELTHVKRWLKHMQSYTLAELKALSGDCKCCSGKCEEKKAEEKVEVDLFGESESEDEEAIKKAEETRKKIAEAKAAGKKMKKVDRSMLIIHIKPWEDTTDMAAILAEVPSKVVMEGLTWGKGELQDGPFNIKFIAIACIIVDDLCSADDLCESIINAFGDEVLQNADIVTFNKCE